MKTTELAAPSPLPVPDPTAIPVPVLCDNCRDKGVAGEGVFAAIPDILNFTPVPRRVHVNNWTETHQRAFIAALAITGSPRRAARAIGRHQFGAEQLRKHRRGRSFADAWDAALEIAREREAYRVSANLADLAAEREAELVRLGKQHHDPLPEVPVSEMDEEDHREAQARIRERLLMVRRHYLSTIADDPDKRRAWDTLCGPADWDKARNMERQDDEPFEDLYAKAYPDKPPPHNLRQPGMVLAVNAGMMNHHLGVPGPMDELRRQFAIMEKLRAEGRSEEEVQAQMEIRADLLAQGWREDEDGTLHEPDDELPSAGE